MPRIQRECHCGGQCSSCQAQSSELEDFPLLQAKLRVGSVNDEYEREADRVAGEVMRMPAIPRFGARLEDKPPARHLRRLFPKGKETPHRMTMPARATLGREPTPSHAEAKVDKVIGGQPLPNEQRIFFESRFGADFGNVRIHTGESADTAARAVGAHAFTRGGDIVFRDDQYHPNTYAGRRLLAHELAHVVQQGAASGIQHRSVNGNGERHVSGPGLHVGVANEVVQCWPGDGMSPPGDCGWAKYLVLRGAVETAKAVVSTLGACAPGDSCLFLATKIAAITAEIAARVALDATCFRGGDTGHRQQVQDKINMMNRCYRFFTTSNCPTELITAMAVVVETARVIIAAAAVAVSIALVIALIEAIIALAEVIAALIAAAAEAAEVVAAVAAVVALLVLIKDELSPEESSGA